MTSCFVCTFLQADAAKKELLLSLLIDGEVDIHRGEFCALVEIKVKTNNNHFYSTFQFESKNSVFYI